MVTPINMPSQSDRSAPVFDPSDPRSLRSYIEELEMLLKKAHIKNDQEKKKYFVLYLSIGLRAILDKLPKYTGPSTFAEFLAEVRELFPAAIFEEKYVLADLERLRF